MSKHFIVLKDFDKQGTVYFDMDKSKDPDRTFRLCAAAAPYWLEVVSLNGPTKESAFNTYAEYTPTKEVDEATILQCCLDGKYDFGTWLDGEAPDRTGWKNIY